MTGAQPNTVTVTDQMLAEAETKFTPEYLAWFNALTGKDIAAQIASNPDAAAELTDE